jgi:hypothetical protein
MHLVTDELLAEGKSGCYINRSDDLFWEEPRWEGPYCGDEVEYEIFKDIPEDKKRGGEMWKQRRAGGRFAT